jgi:hypothetical protein
VLWLHGIGGKMNKIILIVDNKETKHIYETHDSDVVLAVDKLLFYHEGVHYKSVPLDKEDKT